MEEGATGILTRFPRNNPFEKHRRWPLSRRGRSHTSSLRSMVQKRIFGYLSKAKCTIARRSFTSIQEVTVQWWKALGTVWTLRVLSVTRAIQISRRICFLTCTSASLTKARDLLKSNSRPTMAYLGSPTSNSPRSWFHSSLISDGAYLSGLELDARVIDVGYPGAILVSCFLDLGLPVNFMHEWRRIITRYIPPTAHNTGYIPPSPRLFIGFFQLCISNKEYRAISPYSTYR